MSYGRKLLLVASIAWLAAAPARADAPDYLRDIKPILAARCFACHGNLKQESGLRLDARGAILAGGDNGPAAAPGNPAESPLIARVTAAEGERMPPEGEPLTPEQIELLRVWIAAGAGGPDEPLPPDPRDHWSFKPVVRPAVPPAPTGANSIDAFLAAKHQEHGLSAAPAAPPHIVLRRLHLDLIGVPPTRDELATFLADPSQAAYESTVDRLLASPMYGQRWARHWMDVWRYSDWAGFGMEVRYSQRHIWRWRDWIVDSLNEDKPYDRMIVEMLAGDELAPGDPQTMRATGFLVRNWFMFNRNAWLDNSVEHTAKAFLGLTINCARCHDHKYDPLPQDDYYRFRAFFEPHNVRMDRVPGEADLLKDGLPRVFDKDAAAPTYVFDRGNEATPLTERPIAAVPPSFLGLPADVQPVSLPAEAYYPGLAPFWQQEALSTARAGVDQARQALVAAEQAATAAPASDPSQIVETLVQGEPAPPVVPMPGSAVPSPPQKETLALRAAELNFVAVAASIAADRARYAASPGAEAPDLALAAGIAHRSAECGRLESLLFDTEQKLEAAKLAAKPEDAATQTAVTAAQAELDAANKSLADARSAAASPTADYPALSEIYPQASTGRRLALARWIANPANPLTARVAVNHIWTRHFAAPLVPSVFDFGHNGQQPSHPELLDWLAAELMEGGQADASSGARPWAMKRLHRLIVTSEAYRRQSWPSGSQDASLAIDPDNRWLWRMNSRRMEAESVRDSVLFVAGKLDVSLGGPALDQTTGLSVPRRSLYFHHAYEKKMLFLTLFDGASENECYQRDASIVPQQALALANSRLTINHSRILAAALSAELAGQAGANDPAVFVRIAFTHILGRPPTAAEAGECASFLADQATLLADPQKLAPVAIGAPADIAPAAEPHQRAREDLVHVLFNHHDFVTVR